MSKERSIPKLEPKLAGQYNYAEWISMIEMALTIHDIGDGTIWDIVAGTLKSPVKIEASGTAGSSTGKAPATTLTNAEWTKANYFAILTMKKNCEISISAKIGITKDAHQAYKNLKANYEGKPVTDLGVLLASITKLTYDDRSSTIEEHIAEFERKWDFTAATLSTGEFTKKKFGNELKEIIEDDEAKAEFLLLTLPPLYNTLVENLRTNSTYTYGDIVRQLTLYVPGRQRGRRSRNEEETKESPVILKTEKKKDNGKRCDYCIGKGWKGLNHVESECYTKKREEKKDAKSKKTKEADEGSEDGVSICHITIRTIGGYVCEKMGKFQYDTATSHHTTNRRDLLRNIRKIDIEVTAHDGNTSTCSEMGTLVITYNGQQIRHPECLYHPTYSNLISGQRMGPHSLLVDNNRGLLTQKYRAEYKLEIDERGGMWITPEESHEDIRRKEKQRNAQTNSVSTEKETAISLHERYGHISYDTLRKLPEYAKGYTEKPTCKACEKGKATKPAAEDHSKSGNQIRTSRPLQRLHGDLVGPIKPITTSTQYEYLLVITDDYTRYMVTKPL